MIGKLRTLKLFLSAYRWLLSNSGAEVRFNANDSVLLTASNTFYAPYLPGMLNGFNQEKWCVWFFNPHLILTLFLKAHFHSGRFSVCIFKRKQSRLIHLGNRALAKGDAVISADFFNSIERKISGSLESDACMLPFVMHASQYQNMRDFESTASRSIRIFFSGNSNPGSYDNPVFRNTFEILNRHEIKQFVFSQFEDLLNTHKSGDHSKPLWWIDWEWKPGQRGGFDNRIENDEWLSFLDKSVFFLACPGVSMPMCHNLIESMYSGCIPILQHPKLFDPPLQDGINCLVFSASDSLKQKIETALSMNDEKLLEMQEAVKQYYHAYLSPESFKTVLTNPQFKRYYFQVNQVSTQLWSQHNKAPLRVW